MSRPDLRVLGAGPLASELERAGLRRVLIERLGDRRVPPVKYYKCTKCRKCHVVGVAYPRRSVKQVARGFKGKCFKCGMEGHRMVECSGPGSSKGAPHVCASCGKWGHKAANCPQWV